MSMKMACNRCNKVKEDGERFNCIKWFHHMSNDNQYEDSEYDLCPECAKLFSMFINGGTVEEDRYKDSKPCSVVIHKLAGGNYGIEYVMADEKCHFKCNENGKVVKYPWEETDETN